jgi:putative ABC transport system permease protein
VAGIARPAVDLRQQSAVLDDSEATRLHDHPGQVDALLLQLSPGAEEATVAERLRDHLGDDCSVLTGGARGRAEVLDSVDANTRLIAISGSLLGIAVAVAIFVVAGMLSVLVQQRHREIALLRAIAATPRQIRRMIGTETLVITMVGTLLGIWPGLRLAETIIAGMRDQDLLPGTFHSVAGPVPVLAAVAEALLIAQGATWIAGRRASRVRPVEALAAAAVPTARLGAVRWILCSRSIASPTSRPWAAPASGWRRPPCTRGATSTAIPPRP